ncbi:hypothetical protein JD844_022633, partial [Phrynosoma platyrhinos]
VPLESRQLQAVVFQTTSAVNANDSAEDMIALTFLFALLWDRAPGWGFKDGVLHNSIWLGAGDHEEWKVNGIVVIYHCHLGFGFTERAAGVYHREGRMGKYQLTYAEAKAVCEYEGGHLATYQQLEAARKIGMSMQDMESLYCGDELPDDVISTGNVMTLKFLSDASITAGGFQIKYIALDPPKKNTTIQDNTNYLVGRFGIA